MDIHFSHTEILGFISTALMLASRGVYFTSIFRGQTKPHAFSWLIWGVISSIGFAAQVAEGAGAGAWARGVSAATCFMLVILALMQSGRGMITRADWITLAAAFLTIPLWVVTKTPVWSVVIVVIIDLIGYAPTVRKSWGSPWQEKALSYFISSACAFFAVLAVENYTLSTWLYSATLTFSNAAMGVILLWRRQVLRGVKASAA